MVQTETPGVATGGKPINLGQLQTELVAAGANVGALGMAGDAVYTYDADGAAVGFAQADEATVGQAISSHVAMRDKTSAEYAAEFQDAATTAARKQEIRDMQNGLLPPEQVPFTQAEWDAR